WVGVGVAGKVVPAVEVHVGFEVRLPCVFDGGLERHNEHTLSAEPLRELVGGEGLAEAHFRVPEEARNSMHVLIPDGVEVRVRFLHGCMLLTAHCESLVMR